MKILLAPAVLALHLSAVQIADAETIKIGAIATEHGMTGKMDSFFAKKAEELSDGELKFQIFWAGAIGTATEIIPLIKDGALEVGSTAPAFYGSEMPVVGITNSLPFVFENATVAMRVQDALSRSDPHYLDEYKRVGVFPIVQHGLAASHLMCSKPVRNLDDLKGLKIRSYGFFLPVAINALGAVPVSMQLSEVYESMQRGVIDCVPVAYSTALDYKLEEVGKYWSDINLGAISGPALYTSYANYKEGGWSAERISVIDEAATLTLEEEEKAWVDEDARALERAKAAGVEIIPFTDADKVTGIVPDMLEFWEKTQVEKGLDPQIAADVVAAVKREMQAN